MTIDSSTPVVQPQRFGCRKFFGWGSAPAPLVGRQIKLRDGRLLSYAEFGAPGGQPVFFFHGLPGSRLFRHPDDGIADALGVRLITIDRPGFGLSSFQRGRRLLDWPDDVTQLADALGLDRFAVAGVSAGGPYAAACAFKLPQRLTRAALISAAAPPYKPGVKQGMTPTMRLSFATAGCGCLPWWFLLPPMLLVARNGRRHPERLWRRMLEASPEPDRRLLQQPAVKAVFLESFVETYRQGSRGHIADARLVARPWGFEVQNITIPVSVWQGTEDIAVPVAMGYYLAGAIPNCQPHFIAGEAHLLMFRPECWREILASLLAA